MNKQLKSALLVLSEINEPLTTKELVEIGSQKWYLEISWKTPNDSMASVISHDIKYKNEKSYFIRVSAWKFILNPFMKNEIDKKIWEIKKDIHRQSDINIIETWNNNKSYTEDELELIFSLPPTKDNCKKLAKILWRTEHAIEQQYQWGMLSDKMIEEKNIQSNTNWNKNMPCRVVSKRLGWVRTY